MTHTQTKAAQRQANLDLLRIIFMLLIIFLHSIDHTGVLESAPAAGIMANLYVRFAYMLSQVCVNIYVMLSGYFLLNSRFKVQKLAALWLETVFYAFTIKLGFMLTGKVPFSVVSLASCLFPFFTGRYWFITIYVGLYALSPFLNNAIRAMDRKQHLMLNITLMLLFSAWNSVHPSFAGMNSGGGWGLAWFVVLYFSAAWFRLYYDPKGNPMIYVLIWTVFSLAVAILFCLVGERLPVVRTVAGTWYHYNSLPAYISTVAVFVGFLNIRLKENAFSAVIRYVAPSTFGVYLIHAHANMSPYIWERLNLPRFVSSPLFPLIQLAAVFGVFTICTAVDIIRRMSIGRIERSDMFFSFSDSIERRVSLFLERIRE